MISKHQDFAGYSQVDRQRAKVLRENAFEGFSGKPQTAELYEQIGRLKVQLEWLKKVAEGPRD